MSLHSVLAVTARKLSLGCVDGDGSLSAPHPGIQVDLWSSAELEMLDLHDLMPSDELRTGSNTML